MSDGNGIDRSGSQGTGGFWSASMSRRELLKRAGAAGLVVGASGGALGSILTACGGDSESSDSPDSSGSGGSKKYRVALSMSYVGNSWQQEAQNLVVAEAKTPPYDELVDLKVFIAGTNLQTQISQMQQIISGGYDAIICYPLTPTGLDSVMRQGVAKGVVIVSYDNVVETPGTYYVSIDQEILGRRTMTWLCEALDGKGKIFMNRGVPGTYVDTARNKGAKDVLADFPDVKVVAEFDGMWDVATSQSVSAAAIAAHPDVDGIWSQAGAMGIIQTLEAAGIKKLFPMADEASNSWRLAMVDSAYAERGLSGCSEGSPAWTGAYALKLAVAKLEGTEIPQANIPENEFLTSEDIVVGLEPADGANAFPADRVPADFYADWYNLELCPELTLDSALSGTPTPGATAAPVPTT